MRQPLLLLAALFLLSSPLLSQGSWRRLNSGTDAWLSRIVFTSPDTGWVTGANGTLLHTTDGGARWESRTLPSELGIHSPEFHDIHFTSSNVGFLAGSYQDSTTGRNRPLLLRTSDKGGTWIIVLRDTLGSVHDLAFATPDQGYACGSRFARTTDGGLTWSYDETPEHHFNRIGFRETGVGFGFYSSEPYTKVMATTDHGVRWNDFSFAPGVSESVYFQRDIDYIGNATWLFATSLGILRSTDDGEEWTRVHSNGGAYECDLFQNRIGYSVSGQWEPHLINKTTDGGITWTTHDTRIPGVISLISIAAPSELVAYAVGSDGIILKTTDGGGSPLSSTPEVMNVATSTGLNISTSSQQLHCTFPPSAQTRTLLIYDMLGQTTQAHAIDAGTGSISFSTESLSPGLYWCGLGGEVGRFVVDR